MNDFDLVRRRAVVTQGLRPFPDDMLQRIVEEIDSNPSGILLNGKIIQQGRR